MSRFNLGNSFRDRERKSTIVPEKIEEVRESRESNNAKMVSTFK